MSKGFTSIILLLIIVAIGGMAFTFYLGKQSNKPKDTLVTEINSNTTFPTIAPSHSITPPSGWVPYSDANLGLSFYHPTNLEVNSNINDATSLVGDDEFWVALSDSDQIYVTTYAYSSSKTLSSWWETEGKQKFSKLEKEIEEVISPSTDVILNYAIKKGELNGKETLQVVVSSNYSTPQTPEKRNLTILQHNGNIIMISYQELGTVGEPSTTVSKQILSTYQFN